MDAPLRQEIQDALIGMACRALAVFFFLARRRSFPAQPRSILILKPCCVGDVLLATPLIAALRQRFTQARIDFAVGPWARAMVENNPHLDGLLDCGPVGSENYNWVDYWRLVRRIGEGRYRVCLVLDRSPLIALLPFLAGIPYRVGLDSGGRGFSLTLRVPLRGVVHEADLYLETARSIGIHVRSPRLEYHPAEADRAHAREWLDPHGDDRPLIALIPGGGVNPGGSLPAKRWPAERFARTGDRAAGELEARLVILGGPQDQSVAQGVMRAMQQPALDLAGVLSWGQTAAVLERCALAIGNDTGAMHLAVAVGTPVVAIFGPSDPRVYGPLDPRSIALGPGRGGPLPRGEDPRRRDMAAIVNIGEEEVYQAVRVVWGRVRRGEA